MIILSSAMAGGISASISQRNSPALPNLTVILVATDLPREEVILSEIAAGNDQF
jgi:hypothetical protein